jgi:hypothetical protein
VRTIFTNGGKKVLNTGLIGKKPEAHAKIRKPLVIEFQAFEEPETTSHCLFYAASPNHSLWSAA